MRLTKKQRAELHMKYAGRCAYCGCELGDRWHADHFEPVIRLQDEGVAENPANHTVGNMMPACAPCNISKGRQTLEGWRQWLAGHINSLNSYTPIYRIAKAYGLIVETGRPVVFHFESVGPAAPPRPAGQVPLIKEAPKEPAPMSTTMTPLEQALIAQARAAQVRTARYLWQTTAGQTSDDDREEFLMQYGALSALLSLAHEKASGLTPEAVQQLREIEVAEVK
ncbi:TPA: HNH endonuclease, partial [Pseudomonas aeruginosa]